MSEDNTSDDKQKTARTKVSDGIKQGIGVLSAFKDALEETINDARERGDLSSDKAKDVMKNALNKAQEAAEGARERLDFVSQKEFDSLGQAVDAVKDRVSALEARFSGKEPDAEAKEDSEKGT
jgi:polyhydroxyalkanoate synthesis regulator phasin